MKIEVLGPGCRSCNALVANVEVAVRESGVSCSVEKVADMDRLLAYQIMSTPALVVDGDVKVAGRVPSVEEIKEMLR
jgi:small redox-active disulfide protein 2